MIRRRSRAEINEDARKKFERYKAENIWPDNTLRVRITETIVTNSNGSRASYIVEQQTPTGIRIISPGPYEDKITDPEMLKPYLDEMLSKERRRFKDPSIGLKIEPFETQTFEKKVTKSINQDLIGKLQEAVK